jgi:hypothetical protein
VSVDDARRAYLALGRRIEGYARAHVRKGSSSGPAATCGACELTSLAADAASLSLDCAVAEASRTRRAS